MADNAGNQGLRYDSDVAQKGLRIKIEDIATWLAR